MMNMKKNYLIASTFFIFSNVLAQNLKVNQEWWQPNGEVKVITSDSNTIYVGGTFTSVAPNIKYGCQFDTLSKVPDINFNYRTNPDGKVYSSIEDGNGGWIIGGSFSSIGEYKRTNLAWLNGDGTIKPWAPKLDGPVLTITIKNGTIYIGGDFRFVNDQTRFSLASFELSSGNLTNWQIMTNGSITCIDSDSSDLFFGGSFTSVAESKNRFDLTLNINNPSNPDYSKITPNGNVLCSVSDGQGGWYIGGEFTKVGNVERNYLAKINSDGTLSSWDPKVNGSINHMNVLNNLLYVLGNFTTVGDSIRQYGASIIDNKGKAQYSEFQENNFYKSNFGLYTSANYVYAATTNGLTRFNNTGTKDNWSPDMANVSGWKIDGTPYLWGLVFINAVFETDTFVIISGDFNWLNGKSFSGGNCAVFSSISGKYLSNYNLSTIGKINIFAHESNDLYAVGDFSTIGGGAKSKIAKINISDFSIMAFNLTINGLITNAAVYNHKLYLTGGFDSTIGVKRDGFIEIDADDGSVTNWVAPISGQSFYTMSFYNNQMYLGGGLITGMRQFTKNMGACKLNNSNPNSFSSQVDDVVYCLKASGNELLIGGKFTKIGDSASLSFGRISKATGLPTKSYPDLISSGAVYSIACDDAKIYIGGFFYRDWYDINGNRTRSRGLISINKKNHSVTALYTFWGISVLKIHNKTVYAGGYTFDYSTGVYSYGLFKVNSETLDPIWQNECNSWIRTLSFHKSKLYIGGDYTSTYSQKRNNAFALDAKTGAIKNWNPEVDGSVNTIILKNTNVYIGGLFNNVGGQARTNLAAVDKLTAAPLAWRPNPNGQVLSLANSNDTLYVGGSFTTIGGANRNNLASLDISTSYALNWDPSPNSAVSTILPYGDKIYVGGSFQTIGGQGRNFLAKFKIDGTLMPWNAYVFKYRDFRPWGGPFQPYGGGVKSMKLKGNSLFVGGDINLVNYTKGGGNMMPGHIFDTRDGIAEVDATTGSATTWNAMLSDGSIVNSLILKDSFVIAGGSLNMANDPKRPFLTSLYTNNAKVGYWMANPDNEINTLHLHQKNLIVGGKFNNIDNKVVNYLAAFQAPYPFISSFYPTTAFTNDTVIIYGENFTGATKVTFGDVDALSFKVISDNGIHAIVGAGASGLVKVETPIGIATKSVFTFSKTNATISIQTNQINIYPNPVTNVLNINLKAEIMNSRFTIYNIQGLKMMSGILDKANNNINLEVLASGIYILTIEGQQAASFKLIKQ